MFLKFIVMLWCIKFYIKIACLFILVFLGSTTSLKAQSSMFEYDASGNRIKRVVATDLRLLLNMPDNNFTVSSLSKNCEIKVFNMTPANTSNPSIPIIISILKTPDFSISLFASATSSWVLETLDPYTVVIRSKPGVTVTNGSYSGIWIVMTASSTTANGLVNLNFNIEDGSGGEINNTNNSISRQLLVNL